MLRRLLTPRALVGLVLTLCASAGMLLLGRWQLGRGETTHSLQNYAYAVEWVMFAAFAIFCFYKLALEVEHEPEEPDLTPDVVLPPPRPAAVEPEDDELAAYNAYLARLNAEQSR